MPDESRRVADLSRERLQRLVERLKGKAPADAGRQIGPQPAGLAPLPASFAQERLWFLEQLEPGTALYNVPIGLRLRGRLRIPALAAALSEIVARHESLRTTFAEIEGYPYQVVAPAAGTGLPRIDLSALPEATREAELGRLATEEARRPFDLACAPLLRASLFRLSGEDHAFVCILHHITSDGWSSGVLIRELTALYAAFSAGLPSPLPPLPIQYGDYAVWQREHLSGEMLAAQLAYWRERLAGLPLLNLPTDRTRPAQAGGRSARCRLCLSAGPAEKVRALALQTGATPFMVLLTAFEILLSRLSGQTDLAVGTPVAGRHRTEVENLIGFFVNTLVLRAGLADEPSFSDLLASTRRYALEAYTHQELPFEKLVEHLQTDRHLGRTPLFQAFFVLQTAPAETLRLPGLALEPLPMEIGTAKFDLTLALAEEGGGFAGELVGSADLFEEETIRRWAGCFEHLLTAALQAPGTNVFALPLLGEAERRTILGEWSSAGWKLPAPVLIHEIFAEQAARTPGKVAAVCQGAAVTYRELDDRAGRLAHRLAGFGEHGLVGLIATPDLPLLAGMLGILKAGSGFVPLDPDLPAERLERMMADCGLAVLAADRRSLARAEEIAAGAHVVCLEDDLEALPPATAGPGDGTVYVIFTSGSTGVPKGVPITHENLVPLLLWSREVFGFGEHTRVLQSLSYAFDFGVFEILTTLLFGGTLYLRGEAERSDVEGYVREAREHAVDTFHTTPSFFRAVAAAAGPEGLPTVRVLHFGGEALGEALVAEAFRVTGPECRVFNGYGPTEAAVSCSLYEVGRAADWRPRGLSSIPIGQPEAENRLYVLDRRLEPVPAGVPGELLVGGVALSRGYLGRPDLTAARFIPDPFGEPGGRLYRTGDLVRFHPDSAIEFLGRADNQVKVRGYRIELEEIEAALAAHPEVGACAVVAVRQEDGDARLLAYVAARRQPAPSAGELSRFLGRTLPAYMVPPAFVFLPELPLNVSGKVDRKALPAPEGTAATEWVAPRTPLEELLAGLWEELLGRERVGARDNFFELGGHSLLATRLLTRVRTALGVDLPVRRLFEAPTIEALAAAIESAEGGLPLPALLRRPRQPGDEPPLSFSQERLWFLDRMDPGAPTYNMPGTVGLTGRLDVLALAAALRGVVERHEVLRTVFPVVDGEPRQHILPALAVGLPVLDLAGLPPADRLAEAERLAGEHARHRFDLARGPLLDAALLRVGRSDEGDRHHLLVVLHHVICDGWSFTLLVREVGALYAAFVAGRPSPLPELPVQYADFAAWQRERVAASRQTELAYWLDRLGGEVAPLELPMDRPRPAVQTYRGGQGTLLLPPGLAGRLTAFGRAHGATLFMTLLAAIKALFHRHSGQDDILIGAPVAGRRAVETESLIGCFLNTLVLRTGLGGQPGFRDLVARVREVTLGAYSHQDVPFEAILASLPQQRDLSRTPLFQVMVNLLNLPTAEMSLPGLALESLRAAPGPSKLDMTFYVREGGDGLRIELVYNAGLFDAARIEEVLAQLEAILDQALERPDEPVGALSLVTAAARSVLPDPAAELSAAWEGAVHEVFARHAGRAPGALAVTDPVESWTYGELDLRSDRLAAFLRAGGVRPGDVVAFWAHRSAPLVWGVLGALKAGAAFLMLDPRYPAPRQAQMLGIARPTAWLRVAAADPVPAEIEGELDAIGCACRLTLPARAEDPDFLADVPAVPPSVEIGPDDTAYVAFTSGSTGVPKGVLGRHGSLSHFIPWLCRRFELSAADRFSMLSGLAHDPLHRDIFTPLQIGATVVIPDPETMDEPGRLATWMRRAGVTVAHLTPALGQVLTTEAANRPRVEVPSLRSVFLVGDVLTRRDVARLCRLAPAVTCVNYYGSTETQRAVGYHVAEEDGPREILPLGRGIPDVQILVLNPAGALAGIGELGEISMRSPHIALGYLGDPQLTSERFVADRYRTGDLGRYLPNGEAVFVGRADTQVKIRGFRIELGEIESVLGGFPGVREAVVIARQDRGAEHYLAAYVVPAAGAALAARELRAFLRERLPDSMVPATFTLLDELPLTPNRKVDRKALPAPGRGAEDAAFVGPETDLEREIAAVWQEVLGVDRVGVHDNFFEIGGHSLLLVRLHARLQETLKVDLSLMDLFSHPNVQAQAGHLRSRGARERRDALPARRSPVPASGRIAIVGLAGRFPGARNLEAFWHNLREGVESVSFFSPEELLESGIPAELLQNPSYIPARAVVEGEDLFDAAFFEYSPRQAELMDPQLRFFLETSWHALESAGIDPERFPGAIGVYGGVTASSYLLSNLLSHPGLLEEVGVGPLLLGTDRDFLTTQVSYKLGLRGPSIDVQTACSTSLVATHLACQGLLAGDCDVALAGGVSIKLPQRAGYIYQESGADSSDGHCRAFDARADGSIYGAGVGLVVLKRLEDAIANGDVVHAVILGSALNNDGSQKVGYTAPSIEGQSAVVTAALDRAGVEPATIGYVECHGSGTALGDPIEVTALTRAFGDTGTKGSCAIGSVKTNIGHLGAAAGVTGLIKAVLALEHGEIPPSLNFETPNPKIDFAGSPFRVNDRLSPWPTRGPRRAGVNSLGQGGTNAHVVLEEAPAREPSGPSRPWQLLALSARTETALEAATDNLAAWLERNPEASLADAAFTLQVGRRAFAHRRAVVCRDVDEARRILADRDPRRLLTGLQDGGRRPVAVLLAGVGDHYPGMARGLYETEPVFRAALDRCFEILAEGPWRDLRETVFAGGERAAEGGLDLRRMLGRGNGPDEAARRLHRTLYAQPAVFAVEYALAQLWMSWGVEPEALLGYSLGEYVAACLAGVFPLEDALPLVAERARWIEELPAGAMLAVPLPEDEIRGRLSPGLDVAAVNGPQLSVVSGRPEEVAALARLLSEEGIAARQLPTTHAFHSRGMEPLAERLTERVRSLRPAAPRIPVLSNVTGTWMTAAEATDPAYWARHICGPVRFSDGLAELWKNPSRVLLEVGPGQGLSALALQHPAAGRGRTALPSLPHAQERQDDAAFLLGTLGRLWLAGVAVDWAGLWREERRHRLELPLYPFERRRFWVEPARLASTPVEEERAPAPSPLALHERPRLPNPWVAPRNETEAWVAGQIERLLGIAGVGAYDSFFELGGHSLLGTQLLSRLRDGLGVELPIAALFESPTPAELAVRIETARGEAVQAAPPIERLPRTRQEAGLPLSFAQERLWFLHKLQPESPFYNLPVALELRGTLSLPVLAASLDGVAARHEALRTTFHLTGNRPVQVIAPTLRLAPSRVDLDGLPEELRTAEALRLAREEAIRPFDLARGPLVRATVLRLEDEVHVALFNQHHIISDAWSSGILVEEMTACYHAAAGGEPLSLPDLPIQYADYAVWQRGWLSGEILEERLRWWRERLAGAPYVLHLPTDRPRPAVQSLRGAVQSFALSAELSTALYELSRRQGATLFMTLASLLAALLSRQTGVEDLLLGSPVAGRDRTETEGLIGVFTNTLVLRAEVAGDPAFFEILGRMREMALGAYAHQDLPFEKLVDSLQPERSLAHTPLFQVMLVLQNVSLGTLELPGLTLTPLPAKRGTARFDLLLNSAEQDGRLIGEVEYNRDLFDPTTITRLLGSLHTLAEGAVAHPEARLSELPLLSEQETHQLRREWNDTAVPRPAGALLHGIFAAQAACTPGAPALVDEGRTLTYAVLDRLTDRLAEHLCALGVGPDVAVGVLMERSVEMVVALLGILKAGGGYLPLDPEYPGERLAGMVEEARVPVLLAQERLLPVLPSTEAQVLLLEEGWDGSGADGVGTTLPEISEASLAYVLYTSGSTGRPKGVMIPHRGIVNRLLWMQEAYALTPDDRVLQKTPYSFDVSVWELFWPLITGACLVIARPGGHRDAAYLAGLIARERVTVMHFVPSMLQVFLAQPDLSGCASLRLVVASGEALSPDLRQRFRESLPARLENLYGPTEASVDVTAWNCAESAPGGAVPIGRPVANTGIRLLDRAFCTVPIGVAGELCIGGVQLARGYWKRPDLTAERFVPDACGDLAGGRLYRTGDLARHLPDGAIEFLGRIDHQVKVRGFRIELGEIEATLSAHLAVRQAVVVARPDRGATQLVAFFVPGAPGAPDVAELRDHLRRSLPEHMVPTAFVPLSDLPLTASGKVDRNALVRRETGRPARAGDAASLKPRGALEEVLAALWTEILAVDQVGIHDNFFDVGGHSLRLVEVQAGIRRALGRELSIVELFQHPTIASLASYLGSATEAAPPPTAAPRAAGTDIAIIGMDGQFPGAPDLDRFWSNLRDGVESITRLSDEQLLDAGLDPGDLKSPDLVRAEARLDGIDLFDAAFFGFPPREAQALDPQQRLFLEHSWACLEKAGYDPARYAGRIGVFAGSGMGTYAFNVLSNPEICDALEPLSLQTSLDKDYLATRVSYKLGLRGPALSVQTACSTSLVAIHLARQSLLASECDMAMAGGVTLKIRQGTGYRYREGGIASPDGHCRTFDAAARGTVFGSGAGVVLLKRLDDALRDGDTIHAVLKGSAINNDGSLKAGYTAPSVDGQAEAVSAALEAAGVSPDSITYVEAHGTATPMGDPIEVAALTQAFRRGTHRTGFCALGSVKTNIGHLDAAAGVTGLIKTVLALQHRQIPPSLHFETPNPAIDFAASPFRVAARLTGWEADGGSRRAGVSSFGIGGTNAHVVLEEAPPAEPSGASRPYQLLLLSARTAGALEEATNNLAAWLEGHPETPLADVAHTLRVGRQPFEHRRMLVCTDPEDALAALRSRDPERVLSRRRESIPPPTAWLLPGQGSQHPGMGRDLYETEPVFRREIDACGSILAPRLGRDLREILFSSSDAELAATRFAQPALFAVEHALARLWLSWGLRPQALLGHSLGEYVAACLAGVLSVGGALTLVAARGELMHELPAGAMLSVDLPEDEALAEIASAPGLSLAAVNGPGQCVVSGPAEEIDAFAERLARRSSPCRRLHTSHAFHSRMMEPILGRFAEIVSRVELRPPSIPYLSNLTGTWITAAEATDPRYWVRHLREPVRFGDGVSCLLAELPPGAVLLEAGPGRALGRLVRGRAAGRTVLTSMPHPDSPESGAATLLHAAGRLWLAGVEIDWQAFQGEERRRRVPLPTYPFQRLRHWVEPRHAALSGAGSAPVALLLPEGAAADPAWTAALESRGFRVVAVPPGQARPEALGDLLAQGLPSSQEPAPPREPSGSSHARPGIDTPYAAPETETERRLAAIWGDLLGIDRVGVHDDFFELGGHSLLATRLLSRLREAFGQEVPLATIFAEPTIARLAAHLQTGQLIAPERPPIERMPRLGPLPLSFAQQRLWFIDQLEPGSPLYNISMPLRAEGRLRPEVLALTLGEIERRHEALRTVFVAREGAPVQVIRPAAPFLLPVVDLSGLPESRRERLARDLAREEARRPFDLTRDPMLRGMLLRQTPEDHTSLFTVHHIASDGWSLGILVREVTALYAAFAEGRPSPLPELPVQYADFAVWQGACLQGDILDSEISFWSSQLAGLPSFLELPTDRPRPAVQSFRGATSPARLSAELSRQAQALARREGATLFMVLLAGFQALLARYSGQQDLAVGSPVAGRNRLEIEDLIGFFVNTLVMRGDLSGEPSFRELLGRTRETALAAHLHQDVPFEKLVQELAPERSLAHTPLFQVMFVLQNAPLESLEIESLRLRPASGSGAAARFDLTLSFEESQGNLAGAVEYATDLFDATTVDRLVLHYERLLAGLVEEPERRLSELDLLTVEEALQLRAWNETATAYCLDRPLHAWIEDQTDRTPLAVAVTCAGEDLSYRELDRRANRLARRLRSLGVGPEARVAICLERSAELVVALLAVLKAGGAYVPLDPEYPRERLAFMLSDARPAVLLSSEPLRDLLPEPEAPVVWLDREAPALDAESGERLPGADAGALQLAYMIYTSGSTGLPKGVKVPHRALVNFLFSLRDLLGIGPGDRLLSVTSLSFDIAALELYLPLLSGATVEVVHRGTAMDGERLRERLEASRATFMQATPSTWRMLVRSDWQGSSDLTVLCGGEALPEDLARDLTHRAPAVWNLYGPTETTVWSSASRLSAAAPEPSRVTLGRPIANTAIHLLDRHFKQVPVGVPGELYIGGDGVTRGYLRRPDLTAERFLPDPFATDRPGLRLYRTGDLARRRPDGRVEFLGRVDHQVKLRGFRIEPGEIEAALAALAGVREAIVVVREDRSATGSGDRRLVAYVVGTATPEELRRSLRERLPDYMVPAAFVTLAALPLTPNGKVDRKALPAPEWQGAAESYVEPRTPAEEVLAGIWAELLGLERVGATDHFFDRGGHSLLATQVMSRLRAAFGIELPLRTLFEAPLLRDLAARIEEVRRAGSGMSAPPLVPVPRRGPLPLSFAQRRLWFIDQLEPGSPLYNIPVALRIEGPLDGAVLELCLGEILRRHEALRTVFAALEGAPVQRVQPAAPFVLPLVDLAELPASRQETLALALAGDEAARPFDLTRGPLLRGVLVRLASEDHVLALTLHHIASDGWSMGVLVREVAVIYPALAEGRPYPLPELPVQYADFAVWQSSWLRGEVLESEISFWRRQLAGLPPLLELPTDRPRPAVQSFRGASWPVRLPAELARTAQTLSRREGATLFMVLLAVFQTLLARYSGQRALAVGSPVAGRNRLETEGLIGFFVNTLVLRGDLAGEPSLRELLGGVRETALAGYLHQDLPFEKLIEELAPERSLAHSPLFQVMLALQNAPAGILEVRDLRLRRANVPATTAKFDLTLSLTELGGTLVGELEYSTDLFDAATAGRLTGHFERLLAAAVANPGEPVFALPLTSDAERFQILVEWNDRRPAAEPRALIHELFAAQARRTPETVAVVCGDRELTYAELGVRAERLARRLRRHGVGPDVPVGLLSERSPDMLVGVLGILQAGGACLPLDPNHPAQRLAFLLDDTRCPILLTQAHLAGRLPAGSAEVLLFDDGEDEDDGGLAEELTEGNLAYVIYTSGSTGRPKGVALPHEVLRNLLDWHLATLLGGVRTLQFALLTFDVSFYEMFACWGSGGTLVVVPEELRRDMAALAGLLVEQRIQKAILPVVVLQQLAEIYADVQDLPPLLEITTTGERLQTNRAMAALLRRLPKCAFHNQYGPSETHVATAFPLPSDPQDWPADPPIGRPIWRCSTHVLAPGLVPVPVGVPGDLYIGGVCLARGYLGRPDLTAERFVPDPLGSTPGARLYRTGDKVRLLPSGDLEYLGRFDDQVKIRGFRVELGEIEVLLLAQPGVREAAAVVREDRSAEGSGIPRLVAYVAGDPSVFTPGTLQVALREQLPDYMVPTAFVTLAALPLTANGKVDKKALPAPEWQRPEEEGFLAPRTAVEEILAGIWAELLGLERVGVADHFFELGGHSLLATRAMSRLRSACGVEMPLRDLFEAPLLADLAVRIEAALRSGAGLAAPPLVAVPREGPIPLSYPQERLWFLYLLDPESSAFHLGSAVRLTGALAPGAFAASLNETVRRHEVLRTRYEERGDGPVQIIDPAVPLPLPLIDLGGLPAGVRERELRRLAEREMARPFDLTRDWPLRTQLVRLAQEEHAALFTLHHIAGDGWSLGLLNREVGALYAAFAAGSTGRPPALPEPAVQYADFAVWQRGWLSGERLEEQLAWWRNRLAGPLAVLELPQRRDRPDTPGFRGAACPLFVPAGLRRSLEKIGRGEGATLFMTLLAGFKALLHLYSGQEDLLVGTNVANRDRSEIEGLIGFFVNNLVLRTNLSGDPGFRELVRRVRDVTLGAFVHQEVPFEKVLEAVHPRRQTTFAPLFQAMFVLDSFPAAARRAGGLEITPVALQARTANFDLTLRLREAEAGLGGALHYDTDLFAEAAMTRMVEHYLALLESVAEDPDRPLSTIPLSAESDIRQLANAFSEDF